MRPHLFSQIRHPLWGSVIVLGTRISDSTARLRTGELTLGELLLVLCVSSLILIRTFEILIRSQGHYCMYLCRINEFFELGHLCNQPRTHQDQCIQVLNLPVCSATPAYTQGSCRHTLTSSHIWMIKRLNLSIRTCIHIVFVTYSLVQ